MATALLFVTACAPPPGSDGPALCPRRGATVVEAAPNSGLFSLPRAISPNGEWIVSSRSLGWSAIEVSVQRTTSGSPRTVIGTLDPSSSFFAVDDTGNRVLAASKPSSSSAIALQMWERGGSLEPVAPPVLPDPPSGSVHVTRPTALSAAADAVLWRSAITSSTGVVTIGGVVSRVPTGEVLYSGPSPRGSASTQRGPLSASLTASVHPFDDPDPVVRDLLAGTSRPIGPIVDALVDAGAYEPREFWGEIRVPTVVPVAVSDNGRFVVASSGPPYGSDILYLWDVELAELTPIDVPRYDGFLDTAVADDGRVMFARPRDLITASEALHTVVSEWDPSTGALRTIASEPMNSVPGDGRYIWLWTSPDLHHTLVSIQRPLTVTHELTVFRCT